jgi:hypothetical protein
LAEREGFEPSVEVSCVLLKNTNALRFQFVNPGCNCVYSFTAAVDYFTDVETVEWELIKKDLTDFMNIMLVEYEDINGVQRSVNYCRMCGSKLPPLEGSLDE